MRIKDIRKKHPKHDAFSTLSPLNNALKLFGLSCIYRDGNTIKYHFSFFKFIFFLILFFSANAYSIYVMIQNHQLNKTFTFEDTIQIPYMLGYVQYITDIIFVYKYGRQLYVDYFIAYDHIDTILGMPHNKRTRNCISRLSSIFVFSGIILLIIDFSSWLVDLDWSLFNVYFIEVFYIVMRVLTSLDVMSNCILLKYRLETIADSLQNYYYETDNLPGAMKDSVNHEMWINTQDLRMCDYLDSSKNTSNGRADIIMWLSRLYILLNEQCDFINMKYGFRVLLISVLYLLDMVLMTNLIIRVFLGTVILPRKSMWLAIISTSAKIISDTVVLLCGFYYCEQNYRQTERMIRIIDLILIKKKLTKETQETLKEFKGLIISRPIKFHALNFYRLNYASVVSMLSIIVTYTIILLQNL